MRPPVVVMIVVVAALAQPARACASCACGDPTMTSFGVEEPFAGRLRVALSSEWRVTDEGFLASERERVDAIVTTAAIAYAPTRWLFVGASLPVAVKHLTAADAPLDAWSSGTANAALHLRAIVWTDRNIAPHHLLALTASTSLPTTLPARDAKGALLVDDVQPDTDAVGADAGLAYTYLQSGFALFASARAYAALPGPLLIAPGPALFLDATAQWQPTARVAIQVGADARGALAGTSPEGPFGDGVAVFASSGILTAVTDDVTLGLVVRVPLVEALPLGVYEGSQVTGTLTVDL